MTDKGKDEGKYEEIHKKCQQCYEENNMSQYQREQIDETEKTFAEYWEEIL